MGKTKAVKFRNGGHLAHNDKLKYKGQEIEFVPRFLYLGITLTATDVPSGHLANQKNKAICSINTLGTKISFAKISYNSATRLLHAIVKPTATYGLQVFDIADGVLQSHAMSICGYFWKRWTGISKFTSNRRLIFSLTEDDHLNVKYRRKLKRRVGALYYCNGLHNYYCATNNCYSLSSSCTCCKKLWINHGC